MEASLNTGTVYIVDDDEAVRSALSMLLRSVGLHVQTFDSGQAFLDAYQSEGPGCLVLDVRMPGMSGLELQERLKSREFTIPIIIITGHGDVPMAVRAMKAGAVDFVEKSSYNDQALLERVQEALKRDTERRRHAQLQKDLNGRIATLTPREREVMEMFIEGRPAKAIAFDLGLSTKTVETHRTKLLDKMGARSLVELTRMVMEANVTGALVAERAMPQDDADRAKEWR
jgi:FixJ family two-component response regulator